MSEQRVLTSWKEIAAYMGKGVRTVQRWEEQLELPVRRPGEDRRIVLAFPAELDEWVRRRGIGHANKGNGENGGNGVSNRSTYIAVQFHQGHEERLRHIQQMHELVKLMAERVALHRERSEKLAELFEKLKQKRPLTFRKPLTAFSEGEIQERSAAAS